MALTISVDLSITITAAVPRPDFCTSRNANRNPSIASCRKWILRNQRHRRRTTGDHREQIIPATAYAACVFLDQLTSVEYSFRFFDRAGLDSHDPRCRKLLVPVLFGRPKPANHSSATTQNFVGTTAIDSTLLTVVGHPQTPIAAGNGGFKRGWPFLPSSDSISAVSSPQI